MQDNWILTQQLNRAIRNPKKSNEVGVSVEQSVLRGRASTKMRRTVFLAKAKRSAALSLECEESEACTGVLVHLPSEK